MKRALKKLLRISNRILKVNADKSELPIFKKLIPTNGEKSIKVSNETIIPSSNFKYLGVILHRNLTFQVEVKSGSGTVRHQPFERHYGVGHMGDKSVHQMG